MVALTDEMWALLRMELSHDPAGRGYAGKSSAEIVPLLNDAYWVAGEMPSPLGEISPDDFLARFTVAEFTAMHASADAVVQQFLFSILTRRTPLVLTSTPIQFGVTNLVTMGLLAEDRKPVVLAPVQAPAEMIEQPPRIMIALAGIEGAPNAVDAETVETILA